MNRYDRSRRALAFAIAGLAGFVDATGFMAADGYYVSFMSGNTTRLGVDLVTAPIRALTPAALILGFVAGVTLGAILADMAGHRRKSVVALTSAVLLLGAALCRDAGYARAFLACLVLAMGVSNNSFRQGGEVTVAVTYMTGALVRVGQGLAARLKDGAPEGWLANGGLWLSLFIGAVCGAGTFAALPSWSSWIAVILASIVAVLAMAIERRRPSDQSS